MHSFIIFYLTNFNFHEWLCFNLGTHNLRNLEKCPNQNDNTVLLLQVIISFEYTEYIIHLPPKLF